MDWEIRVTGQPSSIACSHDGTFLALMDFMTGTLTLWNYQTRSLLHSFRPPNARVGYDVSFSPDSVYLAAAHIDGGAVVWETATGKIVAELRGHSSKTESVCFAGRGRYVVTADYKGCVRVWNVGSWNLVQEFKETAAVAHLSAPADGMTLCTATHSGCVGVWDLSEMRQVRLLRGHRGAVYGIANSNDARFLVSTGQDATIRIRDLEADDAETVVVEQSLRCTGMRIGKIRGLDREYRSILLARGAKA
jgi:WD40 repeat protein